MIYIVICPVTYIIHGMQFAFDREDVITPSCKKTFSSVFASDAQFLQYIAAARPNGTPHKPLRRRNLSSCYYVDCYLGERSRS